MNYALVLSLPVSVAKNRISLSLKVFLTPILICVISLLAIYIFQVNSYAKETYLIQDYQKKIGQLTQENKALEINFSKISSLSNLEEYLKTQNFEKISQVKYIQILESQVVAK